MAARRLPACPHCGAYNEGKDRTLSYWANDGTIPCLDIKCSECGQHYQVGMFPLPIGASPSALDEDLRERRRNDKRRKFGYIAHGTQPRPQRLESDRLQAVITIKQGHVRKALRTKLRTLYPRSKEDRTRHIA